MFMCIIITRNNHQARGVFVKPMNYARTVIMTNMYNFMKG